MVQKNLVPLLFILMTFFVSCERKSYGLISTNAIFCRVQFDIQQECNGKYVSVHLNKNKIFTLFLSDSAPLAGPLATFNTEIESGLYTLKVIWHSLNSSYFVCEDSVNIEFEGFENYFIGIDTPQDSLVILVQKQPFLYQ